MIERVENIRGVHPGHGAYWCGKCFVDGGFGRWWFWAIVSAVRPLGKITLSSKAKYRRCCPAGHELGISHDPACT